MRWIPRERFRDVRVGERVRLVRPRTVLPPEEPGEPEVVIEEAAYEGTATAVNPRGEITLDGHLISFMEDATFGEWFYSIFVEEAGY